MKEKKLTGYPSIDKPWLKYYSEEAINAPLPECTMYEYLWECNKNHLDSTALEYFGRKITYAQLFSKIELVASSFSALGIKEGDIVSVMLPNTPESIYCMYALSKLGAIPDMIDLRATGETLTHYYHEANTKIAVVCDLFIDNSLKILKKTQIASLVVVSPISSLPKPIRFLSDFGKRKKKCEIPCNLYTWDAFLSLGNVGTKTHCGRGDDVACILHTSGTTGLPKGVMLTNKNFNAMSIQYRHCGFNFVPRDSFMSQVPPFLAYGIVLATHVPLTLNIRVILLPTYEPHRFVEHIRKLKPNHVAAGPADWHNFLEDRKAKKGNYSFLKTPASGSDSISFQDKKAINQLLSNGGCRFSIAEGYGMTEAGSAVCTNLPQCNITGSVGIPLPQMTVCIYDTEKEMELTYNEFGEICISGPTVMHGYYNNFEATKSVLKVHTDGLIWLHSGDLGRMDHDGCVYLEGRLKRIIIRNDGAKVSPFEIEKVISKNSNVAQCCVVGIPDIQHKNGQLPVAFVVPKTDESINEDTLKRFCDSELVWRSRPVEYHIISALPLTENGKIDYRALEKEAAQLDRE